MKNKHQNKEDYFNYEEELSARETRNILVVDDFPENLMFVGDYLEQHGFHPSFATNGKKALEICATEQPDLILLDISMPSMDGYEICRRIKNNPLTQNIPVIFLTAKVEPDDIIKGFENGGIDYITKPFNLQELLWRIKIHLSLKGKYDKIQVMNSRLIEKIKQHSEELQQANNTLSRLDRIKNDFLLHINHELRTPLNGIVGYVKLLSELNLPAQGDEFIHEISELVSRLVKLSERSLLFTELRTETYKFEPCDFDLHQLISRSVSTIKSRHPAKNVTIDTTGVDETIMLYSDKNLVGRCMNFVIDNAIKFSPDNSKIRIDAFQNDNLLKIKILDSGPGFSDEYLKQAFELFNRDEHFSDNLGFGLGLATANLIMKNLGGSVKLGRSSDNKTEVTLTFTNLSS